MATNFSYDRNTLYLSLAISPMMGFMFIDYNLILSIVFLISLAGGVSLASSCINHINVRIWMSVLIFFSCYGFFLMQYWNDTPIEVIGTIFLGIGTGGLAFILPLSSLSYSGAKGKSLAAGSAAAIPLMSGFMWKVLLERNTYFFLCSALVFSLIFIWKTSLSFKENDFFFAETDEFLYKKKARLLFLFCMFTLLMSFSLGTSAVTIVKAMGNIKYIPALFILGIIAGSIIYAVVADRKSTYNGAIVLLFLCETSVSFCLYQCSSITYLLSVFSTALCVGGLAVQSLWISSFIIGKTASCNLTKWVLFSQIVGLSLSVHVQQIPLFCKTNPNYSPFPLLGILVISFFLFFYLWEKKLILLKT